MFLHRFRRYIVMTTVSPHHYTVFPHHDSRNSFSGVEPAVDPMGRECYMACVHDSAVGGCQSWNSVDVDQTT
jgi:hypothetical protein